jgi:hypothetical protein
MKRNIQSIIFGFSFFSVVFSASARAEEVVLPTLTAAANDDQLREYFDDAGKSKDSSPPKYAAAPAPAAVAAGTVAAGTVAAGTVAADAASGAVDGAIAAPGVKKKKTKLKAVVPGGLALLDSRLPYTANVAVKVEYNSKKITTKYSDNSTTSATTSLALGLSYLRVLGPIEVGPLLSFLQNSRIDTATTGSQTLKGSGLGFGLGCVLNIGDINQSTMVPYLGLGILKESLTSVSTTSSTTTSTTTTNSKLNLNVDLGLKIFMRSHVALQPFVAYKMLLSGDTKEAITGSETTVGSLTGNEISVGMGLATYF